MNNQSKRINRIGKIGSEKHIAAWQSSGLTQAVYCHQHDLNHRYFSVWKKKLLASTNKTPNQGLDKLARFYHPVGQSVSRNLDAMAGQNNVLSIKR